LAHPSSCSHTFQHDHFCPYYRYHDHELSFLFFLNATATTGIYTLSLHDALPISTEWTRRRSPPGTTRPATSRRCGGGSSSSRRRSEEHTSELQSRGHLVCRLLLEKKKNRKHPIRYEPVSASVNGLDCREDSCSLA